MGDLQNVDLKTKLNPIKYWAIMFKGTPKIVFVMAVASFVFGMVNIVYLISQFGVSGIIDGKYVIHSHGHIIKELTEKEFLIQKAKELKAVTAGHILFIGMGTGILYPRKKGLQAAKNA